MQWYWLLVIILPFLVGLIALILWLFNSLLKAHGKQTGSLENQIQELTKQNQDLLNRMMSSDFPTYSTLTAMQNNQSLTTSDEYYPQGDEAELARALAMASGSGLGEETHPQDEDDIKAMFNEMGLG